MADTGIFFNTQPILPLGNASANRTYQDNQKVTGASFADILAGAQKKVSFSQHALQRLQDRSLSLNSQQLQKLDDTVEKMAQKGAKESLIYMDDIALVVSVENRKVITAMDGMSAKNNIFTNIDSAAIV